MGKVLSGRGGFSERSFPLRNWCFRVWTTGFLWYLKSLKSTLMLRYVLGSGRGRGMICLRGFGIISKDRTQ